MAVAGPLTTLVAKDDFLRVPEVAHLCAGGETAILKSHAAAVERFFDNKSDGMAGREQGLMGLLARARGRAADLLHVPARDVAFLGSATEGVNQLANGLRWEAGDNIVVEDIEFPSDIYPWARLQERGVEVRVVRQWGSDASLERLADSIDSRTRVVSVSQVSYLTGRRYDLARLASVARDGGDGGALLSVDATHATGVVPVDASHADILVSSCYKFLLAVHGVALFYCNPERMADLPPQQVGWGSNVGPGGVSDPTALQLAGDATRFEAANPSFIGLAVLDNALEYIQHIGVERIEQHVLALGDVLWQELAERGVEILTPRDPAERGPNICFRWPDPRDLVARMAERGVLIWGDPARVRVSFHAYNDQNDIDRFLSALDDIRG